MDSSQEIALMIAACVVFVFAILFSGAAARLFKFLAKGVVGAGALLLCNAALSYMGAAGAVVGVNAVTVLVPAVLGIPGFVSLYAALAVLR